MAIRNDREYRSMMILRKKPEEREEGKCNVTGYASTFDEYELFNLDGVSYCERIEPTAFDDADLSDVIFLYNHEGMVYARQKNGTLKVSVDDKGLFTEADLSSTEESRKLFEAIDKGLIDQMSFAFTVADDYYIDEREKTTRVIRSIGKVYDVSAVSIPANSFTNIGVDARALFDGAIEKRKAERLEHEKALALAKAKFNFEEV